MANLLQVTDFQLIEQSLPAALSVALKNEEPELRQLYPLLHMICPDRDLLQRLGTALNIGALPNKVELSKQMNSVCDKLEGQFNGQFLFPYRLPQIWGEFPIHSRVINKAIAEFNAIIELHHQVPGSLLPFARLEGCYKAILTRIKDHGSHCDVEPLHQLLNMMGGWSHLSPLTLFTKEDVDAANVPLQAADPVYATVPVAIQELPHTKVTAIQNPFIANFDHNINGAGRIAAQTLYATIHAFGMKIGGHTDKLLKYAPQFIPSEKLYSGIRRQLAHRFEVWPTQEFEFWIERTLHQLGVGFFPKNKNDFSKDILVNPFLNKPLSFITPEQIDRFLKENLAHLHSAQLASDEFNPDEESLHIIAHYLYELIQSFQVNPGRALGIGANWDGTISLANESGTHAFKMLDSESNWARRAAHLAVQRQGPAEAKMNATLGVKFEFQAFFSSFNYMTLLQPTEHSSFIYNALIDNFVSDLFPEPAYLQNETYVKQRKQYVVRRNPLGTMEVIDILLPSENGIYYLGRNNQVKRTPKYRHPGTMEVFDFQRETDCSGETRVCYAGNPIGPLLLQNAQAKNKSVRGHVVYDPIAPDQFIEDVFYGQVIRHDNGDLLPFYGVIPQFFDFKQDTELCGSFVVRMLQSSRIYVHCPTFRAACDQIKTRFLPEAQVNPPALPDFCSRYAKQLLEDLTAVLVKDNRQYAECEKAFYSLFKNLIYSLYTIGQADPNFKHNFLTLFNGEEVFHPISKATCEKLIRDLTVNKPIQANAEAIKRYEAVIKYLSDIHCYFYPKANKNTVQKIVEQAKIHVRVLLNSPSVKAYFADQQRNRQCNLSRKISPGMLYAEFKHGGPSKTIAADYNYMHEHNYPSFLIDADGTPIDKAQPFDSTVDWFAKRLGASAQLAHRYNLFALLTKPVTHTYLRAKHNAVVHKGETWQPLWIAQGALRGLFIDGIALGLWQTATTPFQMIYDFLNYHLDESQPQEKSTNNPLAIPAAPANTPSLRTLIAAESRDFLLELLILRRAPKVKRILLDRHLKQQIRQAYPQLSAPDYQLFYSELRSQFPLQDDEWNALFEPLLVRRPDFGLGEVLQQNNNAVNRNLLQAVFQCLTNPHLGQHGKEISKKIASSFALSGKQITLLKQIITLFQATDLQQQQDFIDLFKFNGPIHMALKKRDRLLHLMQTYLLHVCDNQLLVQVRFNAHVAQWTSHLNTLNLKQYPTYLPHSIRGPLYQVLLSNNPDEVNHYDQSQQEKQFIMAFFACYQHLDPQSKQKILQSIYIPAPLEQSSSNKQLSAKERAHLKWAQFAKRELDNELLSPQMAEGIWAELGKGIQKRVVERLKEHYKSLTINNDHRVSNDDDDEVINNNDKPIKDFYDYTTRLLSRLEYLIQHKKRNETTHYVETHGLLKDLLNTTMNAIINARLAAVDVFARAAPNPLSSSSAIEAWLTGVHKSNHDLRSFMDQQKQQAPSIDHALWRSKCILQVLEKANAQNRVRGTGMQSIVRFWRQHTNSVTVTGEEFIEPKSCETKRRLEVDRLTDSATMKHAIERVNLKLS